MPPTLAYYISLYMKDINQWNENLFNITVIQLVLAVSWVNKLKISMELWQEHIIVTNHFFRN